MKFKVEIRDMTLNKRSTFLFSILHPKTGEPIYEFVYPYQKLGRDICEEIINDINKGLENEM